MADLHRRRFFRRTLGGLFIVATETFGSDVPAMTRVQGRYEHLNIVRINVTGPRSATCYDSRVGHYPCLEFGVVIVFRQQNGTEAGVSTAYKSDGALLTNVKTDFGQKQPMFWTALKQRWGQINTPLAFPPELQGLPESVRQRLTELIDLVNQYESSIDLASRPEGIYDSQALRALYDVTNAYLKAAGLTTPEQQQGVDTNVGAAKALLKILRTSSLDVGTSLLPFVSDARDLYELVTGRDLITGEEIDGFGRLVTAVALVAGSGSIYRRAADGLKESFAQKTLTKGKGGLPGLTYTGNGSWVSAEGLIYRRASADYENSLRHVLRHATPNPAKANHTVFTGDPRNVAELIDRAWKRRTIPDPMDPARWVIDMGMVVGTKGEKKVRLIVEPNTNNVISAYPVP